MRWFWLFIASLVLLTGALYTLRVRAERAAEAQLAAQAQAAESMPQRRARRSDRPRTPPANEEQTPGQAAESDPAPAEEPTQPEAAGETDPETRPEPEPQPGGLPPPTGEIIIEGLPRPEPDSRPDAAAEAASPLEPESSHAAEEPDTAAEPEESAPMATFEHHDDGSFTVFATDTRVSGTGTEADPYQLGWELLKSVQQVYDPKANKDEMPGWLDLLDGKSVRIEGHTLVPVIATTTRELLIMQNPWDGCCIGIPPSPYDAIEATLDHEVDFGNSAVGYGTIEGIFYLDPYVVDGWVLGLFIIENGVYRSGEGVAFPEF
ncbi:MAG: hypothetical protein WD114_02270 [Phycisphaerales bacterium]